MGDGDLVAVDVEHRPGHGEVARRAPRRQLVAEPAGVGEDGLPAGHVVEAVQLLVEEARRSGHGHDVRGAGHLHVLHRTFRLAAPLVGDEAALLLVGDVVHHRVPDGAAVLQEVDVARPELVQHAEVGGVGVVLVEHGRRRVGHHQRGVAHGSHVGRGEREDRDAEPTAEVDGDPVVGVDEPLEADRVQLPFELVDVEGGEQDRRVTVDVAVEPLHVEVVAVGVRHVEVVGPGEGGGIEGVVAGEREPRREVRRGEPRVAQDAAARGLEEEAGVAEHRHPHRPETVPAGPCGSGAPAHPDDEYSCNLLHGTVTIGP